MKKIDTIIAATLATLMLTTANPAVASSKVHKPTKAEIAEFNELWKDDAYKTHTKKSKSKSKKKSSKKSKSSSKKTDKKTSKSKDDIEVYSCNDDQYKIQYDKKKHRANIYFMPFDKWVKVGSTAIFELK